MKPILTDAEITPILEKYNTAVKDKNFVALLDSFQLAAEKGQEKTLKDLYSALPLSRGITVSLTIDGFVSTLDKIRDKERIEWRKKGYEQGQNDLGKEQYYYTEDSLKKLIENVRADAKKEGAEQENEKWRKAKLGEKTLYEHYKVEKVLVLIDKKQLEELGVKID